MARQSKVSDEALAEAVRNCTAVMGVLRYLGLREAGGTHSHYKRRIQRLGLDTSHFLAKASSKGRISTRRRLADEILVLRTDGTRGRSEQLVRALKDKGVEHKCAKCGQPPEWLGKPLTLDVDHRNENWLDDRLENLRFLCPNCHSQFSRRLLGN